MGPRNTSCTGVALSPGANIQNAVISNPAGTVFCLAAGTYSQQHVVPKAGNKFIGAVGAILDGKNATVRAFDGSAPDVTIQNLVIQNYTAGYQNAPIYAVNASGWRVTSNEIRYNAGVGLLFKDNITVRFNNIHHNLEMGFGSDGGKKIKVFDNEIAFNNYTNAFSCDECGGSKLWATKGAQVNYNYSHDNHGPGLWDDFNNHKITYAYNRIENNYAMGIHHEIGYDASIHHNVINNNGKNSPLWSCNWLWCAGISIAASGGVNGGKVEIFKNKVTPGSSFGNAIGLIQQDRTNSEASMGPWIVQNVWVHNNTIDLSMGGRVGGVQDLGNNAIFTTRNNKFDWNHYILGSSTTSPFWWNNSEGGKTFWQGRDMDLNGTFQILAGGTLTLAAGSAARSVTVNGGGTVAGTGTIAGLLNNGGTISPGNSIGTLTVAGNLVQNGGAYIVETNAAGQSDRVNVGGSATLNGGTVQVQAQPGTYARNTKYTILNATRGVSGSFSGVTSNFAFLKPSLFYDASNVYLLLAQSSSAFAAAAQTANQYAVGSALDQANSSATGDFNTVLNALSALSTAQGPAALNAISGQDYSGFSSSMVQGAQFFMEAFLAQAGGSHRHSGKVALAEACEIACDAARSDAWGAWGGGMGGTSSIAGNANSGALTYSAAGFAAGLDHRLTDGLRAGVTVGYLGGSQWVGGFNGQGSSNTVLAGLYGTYAQGPAYLDALVGYAYSANQLQRNIVISGLTARTAQGATGANQLYGQFEGGWRIDLGGSADAFVTPFARLQAYTAMQNGFSESGAQSLNLNIAAQTTNSLRTVLGAQLGGAMNMGWCDKLNAEFRLGWGHEYANTTRPVTASFAGGPAIPFTTFGASPQRDGVVVGLAANTAIADAASLYLRYEGDLSGQGSTHALTAGMRVSWR